jgi:hypothetical protein
MQPRQNGTFGNGVIAIKASKSILRTHEPTYLNTLKAPNRNSAHDDQVNSTGTDFQQTCLVQTAASLFTNAQPISTPQKMYQYFKQQQQGNAIEPLSNIETEFRKSTYIFNDLQIASQSLDFIQTYGRQRIDMPLYPPSMRQ